jgi:hypothetical protein
MSIEPLNLPSLVQAVIWPFLATVALIVFRRPLGELVKVLGQRVHKFSFGGFALELSEVSEMKPPLSLETEIRQLDAGMYPQSGASAISTLLSQLRFGGPHDYIVIDLGSQPSPAMVNFPPLPFDSAAHVNGSIVMFGFRRDRR